MLSKFLSSVVLASVVMGSAPAFSATMVKEVNVEADLTVIQNSKAGEHWTTLSDDLENAVVSRLADRIADEGVKVSIDLDELELANSFESSLGVAESKLTGRVNISHEADNSKFDTYDLTVTFEQAGPFFVPGTDLTSITTDSKEYYDAMIAAFADGVVTRLD